MWLVRKTQGAFAKFKIAARDAAACILKKARALKLAASKDGNVHFVQVFENGSKLKNYHFVVEGKTFADGFASIHVWDKLGREVYCTAVLLSAAQGVTDVAKVADSSQASSSVLFSLSLPASLRDFYVGNDELGVAFVSYENVIHSELVRDELMVNPGIDERYSEWAKRHACCSAQELEQQRFEALDFEYRPLISIITPLFNTPPCFFDELVASVVSQTYENWELVLVNASPDNEVLSNVISRLQDARISVITLESNFGIAENTLAGIKAAHGDYLAFMDHDDTLEPNALFEYVREINADPKLDLLYCDEDTLNAECATQSNPLFKPNFNYDLLITHNYVVHLLMVSRRALGSVEQYTKRMDGAQDYDLTLKVSEVTQNIRRVPKVLYHWRQHSGSTNGGSIEVKPYVIDSSINLLRAHFRRRGIDVDVIPLDIPCAFEVVYPKSFARDVSVVLPYTNPANAASLIASLQGERKDVLCEVVMVGPQAEDVILNSGIDIRRVLWEGEYDFAAMVNAGAKVTYGSHLLIVKQDVRFGIAPDSIGLLRDIFCRDDVGIVSAKTMTTDGLNLHAGLCIKENGTIGYLNQGFIHGMGGGYHGCAEFSCDYSAVDAFCMMVRSADFMSAGGLSADYADEVAVAVDFSFRIRDLGKCVLVNPSARVSAYIQPRQLELGKDWVAPGGDDFVRLWDRWGEKYRCDVLANPNVEFSRSYFRLKAD